MTKEQANSLIERLVDKTSSFGNMIKFGDTVVRQVGIDRHGDWIYYHNHSAVDTDFVMLADTEDIGGITLGHPIMLTDVLEKYEADPLVKSDPSAHGWNLIQIVVSWRKCGFTKSLQDILAEAEWDNRECIDDKCPCGAFPLRNDDCPEKRVMKGPAAELFEYLLSLFPET